MVNVRRLVLDVVKPQEPGSIEFAGKLADMKGVEGVNVSLIEVDRKVENVRVTLEGDGLETDKMMDLIEEMGGAIHSVDEVAAGKRLVEHAQTLEEK